MTDFATLVGTLPDLGAAWTPVEGQLSAEGASADQINFLRDSYADTVSQITNIQLQSGGQIDPQAAMGQAAGFITASQTALGAVQNVAGLVSTAVHASSPAQVIQAANMITGTLIAAATAAGVVSAGVGAIIVAGIGLAASVIGDLLSGSPPAATVCNTDLSQKPTIVVGCTFTSAIPNTPGAPAWRPFPDPSNPDDAGWFQAQTTNAGGFYANIFNWRGDTWEGSFTGSPTRPIDQAFPDYATLAAEQPYPQDAGGIIDFKRAFFVAWKANQAYALNGLVPRASEDLLFHFVNVWNRAHTNDTILNVTPGATGTGIDYESSLIKNLAHQNIPNVPVVNGRLQIYMGPVKSPPAVAAVHQVIALTLRPSSGGGVSAPAPTAPAATSSSSFGKTLLVGTVIVAGVGALGVGAWALATHQSYLGALKGVWRSSGGKAVSAVRKINPLPATFVEAPRESTHVQTLLFPRPRYSESRAKAWARAHGYGVHKAPDVKEHTIRIRQKDPSEFESGSFRTISLGKSGVKAVVGHLR